MSTNSEIPKIIHYCWFGGKKMSNLQKKCLESWKEHLPGYEVMRWDESKVVMDHPFLQYAYEKKKWAFVADYVRLQKLYEFGGIYLDTDMMLIKSLDKFHDSRAFLGAEDENYISAGIIGCVREHQFIKTCLSFYNSVKFNEPLNWFDVTIPKNLTKNFREYFSYNGTFNEIVQINNVSIYPARFFYSLPYCHRGDVNFLDKYLGKDSYAVHLWNESWLDLNEFQHFRKGNYWQGFKKVIQRVHRERQVKYKYVRKNLSAIKESFTKGTWKN